MLYDSTKILLQSILRSLETGQEIQWDDHAESGNACLYEMHQMSGRMYKPYKSDSMNSSSTAQSTLSERLNRAVPHVRKMVIAIRHKDQPVALESGKTALAEMNGTSLPHAAGVSAEPKTETKPAPAARPQKKAPKRVRVGSAK